jgi:hypothetical protein
MTGSGRRAMIEKWLFCFLIDIFVNKETFQVTQKNLSAADYCLFCTAFRLLFQYSCTSLIRRNASCFWHKRNLPHILQLLPKMFTRENMGYLCLFLAEFNFVVNAFHKPHCDLVHYWWSRLFNGTRNTLYLHWACVVVVDCLHYTFKIALLAFADDMWSH